MTLQDGDASSRGAVALQKLGVGYPVFDWGAAWATVQDRSVAALNIIREEADATREEVSDSETEEDTG